MKKVVWILVLLIFISCDKECDEPLGNLITKEFTLENFDKIIVLTGVELTIEEGTARTVVVKTGTNRMDNVHVTVADGILEISADGSCSLRPSYESVKIHVTTPTLTVLRNSSEYTITSKGILTFPTLQLLTENHESSYVNLGDFNLKIKNNKIAIKSNGLSRIHIEGTTNTLNLGYFSGVGKFEGKDLIAKDIVFFHRGNNKLEINPQESLTGELYGTGDVISYNHPDSVTVQNYYTGKLVFK